VPPLVVLVLLELLLVELDELRVVVDVDDEEVVDDAGVELRDDDVGAL
jgi:hypothetical protein